MSSAVRPPAVAGRFYPDDPQTLLPLVKSYFPVDAQPISALGCIVPHAGYIYSGHVAGAVYARISLPARFIILCPNHTGRGMPASILSRGWWETPLGLAPIDAELAGLLQQQAPFLREDFEAHRSEHAIEVELPFLQALRPGFTFVPIALGTRQLDVLEELGKAIARVIDGLDTQVLIVASSDMNHYESDAITRVKDHKAIEKICGLDAAGLFDVVRQEKISMCGFGPAVVMLTATRQCGASQVELVEYATSGDVSGDRESVVGYAGVVVR